MGEVVDFTGETFNAIPAEDMLQKALKWNMESVLVVGWGKDGHLHAGASISEVGELLILLELFKKELLAACSK